MQVTDKWPAYMANLIKEAEITQQDFATLCGVTPGAISQWLSGKRRPNISLLKKIITAVMKVKKISRAKATKEVCKAYLFEYGIV